MSRWLIRSTLLRRETTRRILVSGFDVGQEDALLKNRSIRYLQQRHPQHRHVQPYDIRQVGPSVGVKQCFVGEPNDAVHRVGLSVVGDLGEVWIVDDGGNGSSLGKQVKRPVMPRVVGRQVRCTGCYDEQSNVCSPSLYSLHER